MEYSIKKLGELAGISSRTLRYYDSIGLLKPKRINSSGYRIYGQEEVDRLQQILFFREFEIPLDEIKSYLDDSQFNPTEALIDHRKKLLARRERLDCLIATIDNTIQHKKGELNMTDREKFAGFKQKQLTDNEEKYGKEIREKYGEETVEKANKQFTNLTEDQYNQMEATAAKIIADLRTTMQAGNPGGAEAQAVAALHKEWLAFTWPSYSKAAHRGLADMYIWDERFTKYYDEQAGEGAAQFLREAIHIFAAE